MSHLLSIARLQIQAVDRALAAERTEREAMEYRLLGLIQVATDRLVSDPPAAATAASVVPAAGVRSGAAAVAGRVLGEDRRG